MTNPVTTLLSSFYSYVFKSYSSHFPHSSHTLDYPLSISFLAFWADVCSAGLLDCLLVSFTKVSLLWLLLGSIFHESQSCMWSWSPQRALAYESKHTADISTRMFKMHLRLLKVVNRAAHLPLEASNFHISKYF